MKMTICVCLHMMSEVLWEPYLFGIRVRCRLHLDMVDIAILTKCKFEYPSGL